MKQLILITLLTTAGIANAGLAGTIQTQVQKVQLQPIQVRHGGQQPTQVATPAAVPQIQVSHGVHATPVAEPALEGISASDQVAITANVVGSLGVMPGAAVAAGAVQSEYDRILAPR